MFFFIFFFVVVGVTQLQILMIFTSPCSLSPPLSFFKWIGWIAYFFLKNSLLNCQIFWGVYYIYVNLHILSYFLLHLLVATLTHSCPCLCSCLLCASDLVFSLQRWTGRRSRTSQPFGPTTWKATSSLTSWLLCLATGLYPPPLSTDRLVHRPLGGQTFW